MSLFAGAFQQGCFYGIVSVGVYLTFRILRIPDLTADGAFTLGGATSARLILAQAPVLALPLSFVAGCGAGLITTFLQIKLRVVPILAGFLTMSGLYTINLAIQGGAPNLSLLRTKNLFNLLPFLSKKESQFLWPLLFCLLVFVFFTLFLHTEKGLEIRAAGTNPKMAQAQGINVARAKILSLMLANGTIALAGSLASQYQGYTDINTGSGSLLVGLAGVILGEAIFPTSRLGWKLASIMAGAILYQLLLAVVVRYSFLPAYTFKLVAAALIACTIGMSQIKKSPQNDEL